MRIVGLRVSNFRGISRMEWRPREALCCLIGPGDSTKSTVLDAIEAVLSPRWHTFTETDFHDCNSRVPITIEATVSELSKPLLSDERFGLYIRGLAPNDDIHDEPEDGDQPILTIRLTVDATMEPEWVAYCDRAQGPRYLSSRDRALFGLVRLAGDDARHLTWAQGWARARKTDPGLHLKVTH